MKQIVGFIGLAFLQLMIACSSTAPWETRQRQPTAVSDFKSVAGKWEGLLTSNDPRVLNYDRATLVIDDTGACESAITRTVRKVYGMSVSYDAIDVRERKVSFDRWQTEHEIREGRPTDSATLCGSSKW
jgi:hypothetical protein